MVGCHKSEAASGPDGFFEQHDFYQPAANLFLGLRDPQQRPRASVELIDIAPALLVLAGDRR